MPSTDYLLWSRTVGVAKALDHLLYDSTDSNDITHRAKS